jgi:hypothetical protein
MRNPSSNAVAVTSLGLSAGVDVLHLMITVNQYSYDTLEVNVKSEAHAPTHTTRLKDPKTRTPCTTTKRRPRFTGCLRAEMRCAGSFLDRGARSTRKDEARSRRRRPPLPVPLVFSRAAHCHVPTATRNSPRVERNDEAEILCHHELHQPERRRDREQRNPPDAGRGEGT